MQRPGGAGHGEPVPDGRRRQAVNPAAPTSPTAITPPTISPTGEPASCCWCPAASDTAVDGPGRAEAPAGDVLVGFDSEIEVLCASTPPELASADGAADAARVAAAVVGAGTATLVVTGAGAGGFVVAGGGAGGAGASCAPHSEAYDVDRPAVDLSPVGR